MKDGTVEALAAVGITLGVVGLGLGLGNWARERKEGPARIEEPAEKRYPPIPVMQGPAEGEPARTRRLGYIYYQNGGVARIDEVRVREGVCLYVVSVGFEVAVTQGGCP